MSENHDHEQFERDYWGDCTNTFDEEQKHFVYAAYMEIPQSHYGFDVGDKQILDIGGGPVSMLLKCRGDVKGSFVVDPLNYPDWVMDRYGIKGITYIQDRGEDFTREEGCESFDEAWIYNCLQHTDDPEKIIKNALDWAPILRIFEWINIPPHEGHPIMLTRALLDEWTGATGRTTALSGQGCYGIAYYNVVQGPLFEKPGKL
jgi:hypothetical protein